MRILYFTISYPPYISGVSIFAARRVAAMRKAGHMVGLVTPATKNQPQLEKQQGLTRFALRSLKNPFRNNHQLFFVLPHEVIAIIRDFKPDIIHYNDPSLWPWLVVPWARQRGIKLVFTLHAFTNYAVLYVPLLRWFWPLLVGYWRSVVKQFDLVTVPSAIMLREVAQTLRLPKAPVIKISNGVDESEFLPKRQQTSLKKPIEFLYVGRLDLEKGLDILVKACSELSGNWHVTLVGSGTLELALREQIAVAGLKGKITLAGYQPDKLLPRFYQAADVFVIPSLNESQSIVTLQALATGLPVIASDCTAFPEIVHPGTNGWLFEPANPVALRKCLAEALTAPAKLRAYGKASLKIAAQHSLKHVDAVWLKTYQDLLKTP